MNDKLISFLQKVKTNPNVSNFDEAATKQAIVLPMLGFLGWDTTNIDEVIPEFSVEGGRVDYCLRANKSTEVFLEIKKPAEDLDRHQNQLLEYSFKQGVEMAVLANGITWAIYLPLKKGKWESRRFYTIDILEQDSSDVASRFTDLLSKQEVASGKAVKHAEAIFEGRLKKKTIEDTLPEAWNKITSEPDAILIDLITEVTRKLCGLQPEADDLKTFFRRFGDRFQLLPPDELAEEPEPSPRTQKLPPLKKAQATPIQEGKKISQDDLIPFIVKVLQKYGGRAPKEKVEEEIYQMFKLTFDHPWYQETVSYNVPRWQHNVAWARLRAKKRGIIKSPEESGRGYWELTEVGKKMNV